MSEVSINIKGPSELKLTISISLDKTVRDLKDAIATESGVEADKQRLIYSGRVLKDEDALSTYKIQSSHTIHMVKGVARPAGTDGASSSSTPQQLPTMQAGQNPTDPLTVLNGPMGHGVMAGFNPFAGTGLNPNDPNMMAGVLDSPQFLQQMSAMMSNPALLDQLIASDPNMASMGPQIRQMMNSPQFQQMVSNPESLRQMFAMAEQMRAAGVDPRNPATFGAGLGGGPFGGFGGFGGAPPALGAAPTSPGAAATPPAGGPTNLFNQAAQANSPPSALGGAGRGFGGAPGFGSMFGAPPAAQAGATPGSPPPAGGNPFGAVDPNLLAQMFGGQGGFGGFGGAAAAPPPADPRPVEERFQVQLQQLNDMGLNNAQQNIRALLATGGNVNAAIEYIFGGGGL